jgi:hypothetical protein
MDHWIWSPPIRDFTTTAETYFPNGDSKILHRQGFLDRWLKYLCVVEVNHSRSVPGMEVRSSAIRNEHKHIVQMSITEVAVRHEKDKFRARASLFKPLVGAAEKSQNGPSGGKVNASLLSMLPPCGKSHR